MGTPTSQRTLHLLLIGIGKYPEGSRYPDLSGAVRDIDAIERFFQDKFGSLVTVCTTKLSTMSSDPKRKPTRTNIMTALDQLAKVAKAGDDIWFHYSGHGARVQTEYPNVKQSNLDEALISCDGELIRDIELGGKIVEILTTKASLTVFFDCCHSGSATRGGDDNEEGVRGVDMDDAHPYPTGNRNTYKYFRNLGNCSECSRYQFFGACQAGEKAIEVLDKMFNSQSGNAKPEKIGALTGVFLDALDGALPKLTTLSYGMLMCRIRQKMSEVSPRQAPVFFGRAERLFCGGGVERDHDGRSFVGVEILDSEKVKVCAGRVDGVRQSNEYEVFNWPWCPESGSPGIGIIKIEKADFNTAVAGWLKPPDESIHPSSSTAYVAVLTKANSRVLRARCLNRESELKAVLEELASPPVHIVRRFSPWQYTIEVESNEYSLVENPVFPRSNDPSTFVNSLAHLSRYQTLQKEIFKDSSNSLRCGQKHLGTENSDIRVYELSFTNTSTRALYLTVINFSPYLGVDVVFPAFRGECSKIDPRETKRIEVGIQFLVNHPSNAAEVFRAVITDEPVELLDARMPSIIADPNGKFFEVDVHRGERDCSPCSQSKTCESSYTSSVDTGNEDDDSFARVMDQLGVEIDGNSRADRRKPPSFWGTADLIIHKSQSSIAQSLKGLIKELGRRIRPPGA